MSVRLGLAVALLCTGVAAGPARADRTPRTTSELIAPPAADVARTGHWADGHPAGEPFAPTPTGLVWPDYDTYTAPEVWAQGECLWWRLPTGPLRFPLVTTGNPAADPLAGNLGQPTTRVLVGGNGLDYGRTGGVRLTAGAWYGAAGAEVSGLWLDAREVAGGIRSSPTGSPALYVPVFNLGTGREGSIIVADSVFGAAGAVAVDSRSRLWGWEANGLIPMYGGPVDVTLLGGFRYLRLEETLTLQNSVTDLFFGTRTEMVDRFEADNRFYGGQVGARVTADYGRWFAVLTAKVALGATRQVVEVAGATVQTGTPPTPTGTFPGAIFTQPTNLGRRTDCTIAAVPELNLRAGCQVCGCLRAFVGYEVLYWSRVARPGDQIDRALNPSQSPVFGTGALTGSARPVPLLNTTDFFAHGFTAGLELRY